MSHHEMSVEEVRKHVKVYVSVFAALMVLTALTVGIFYLHLSITAAVLLALVVAAIKGSLVACYFMHLISERGLVFWILGLIAIFFVALMFLPILTELDSSGV